MTEPTAAPAMPLRNEAFQARAALHDALERLAILDENEIVAVLGDGPLQALVRLIAPTQSEDRRDGELLYDYLLRHKTGLAMLAQLRRAINQDYSLEGFVGAAPVYVSPDERQWFEDGVMFVQGEERFGGLPGLYRDGRVSFAVIARDVRKGESLGPDDFLYIDIDEYRQLVAQRFQPSPTEIDAACAELDALLDERVCEESRYQEYFGRHPWTFGLQYKGVDSHARFDDRNIPDFSGVRLRDGSRDILEIKSPCLTLFRADGEFTAEFSNAWHQVERYLDFARREAEYLSRQRGLRFDNPHCNLIAGRDLTQEQLNRVHSKERMNPAITFWSYDDMRTLVTGTAALVRQLHATP